MEFTVHLGERSYQIAIDNGVAPEFSTRLPFSAEGRRCILVTNDTLAGLYASLIDNWKSRFNCSVISIPDGERYKTIATWSAILDQMFDRSLDRSSFLIALGGGVVGDIAGFAASAYMRGIDYIQIPTTLLAMIDSSVGGKTAVDHAKGKNLVGAFHQPRFVLIDTAFLDTLPSRQYLSGYAEMFKLAFIGRREMFEFIRNSNDSLIAGHSGALLEGIRRSVAFKASVVEQDEREVLGTRALLNFGHTFGHSIERFFNFEKVLHGEAVFWGMRCAYELGARVGTVENRFKDEFRDFLDKMPMPRLPALPDPQRLYDGMGIDKKATGGSLRFVLPTEPGCSTVVKDIPAEDVIAVLQLVFGKKP